jgi:hypothetical protein
MGRLARLRCGVGPPGGVVYQTTPSQGYRGVVSCLRRRLVLEVVRSITMPTGSLGRPMGPKHVPSGVFEGHLVTLGDLRVG